MRAGPTWRPFPSASPPHPLPASQHAVAPLLHPQHPPGWLNVSERRCICTARLVLAPLPLCAWGGAAGAACCCLTCEVLEVELAVMLLPLPELPLLLLLLPATTSKGPSILPSAMEPISQALNFCVVVPP